MLLLLCMLVAAGSAAAQAPSADSLRAPAAPKTLSARSVEHAAPRIDGLLDDPAWTHASWRSDFRQLEPVEGARPSQRTEVAILYDDEALYVGARLYSDDPASIRAQLTRHDDETNADQLAVSLDTYHNRRTAYTFVVTASGVRIDYYHAEDDQEEPDYTFDPVWSADARVGADGWTAEMRIPFSQLRFHEAERVVWGLNINRKIPARNEDVYWVVVPRRAAGWASRFGTLEGISTARASRGLELRPYVASGATVPETVDAQDPFDDAVDHRVRVGSDVKLGLGPNLTLDATINPDFGQVEADPAEVNLTAFETFFEERRPFFTEGSDLLDDGLFYSRRIGAAPRGAAEGDYVERPENTTILGAAKLSGRFASGFSLAALGAVTDHEHARTFDVETEAFGRVRVEPRTGYLAVAAQQEFGQSRSAVNFIGTTVVRDQNPGSLTASVLNDEAYAGRVGWNLRARGGAYELRGELGMTHVRGTAERIAGLQQGPAHYFQRPDADHVRFDPTRTQLTGSRGYVWLLKNSGAWVGDSFLMYESPEYEPNDLGQLERADEILWETDIAYRQTEPRGLLHRYSIGAEFVNTWDTAGQPLVTAIDAYVESTWSNFWETVIFAGSNPRFYSDTETRGGPRMALGVEYNVGLEVATNPARRFQGQVEAFYEWDELERRDLELDAELAWRVNRRLALSLTPEYVRSVGARQYVATREGGGPAATFGNRYIFSNLDRTELSAQLRLDYTLTPDLTLELYAEPFAASGRFYDYGELAAAGGLALRRYGTAGSTLQPADDGVLVTDGAERFTLANQDFNVRSFRSNLVLRWAWRPGSTLFVVWQQDRSGFDPTGRFVRPATLFDAVGVAGDHFFSVKLSYWIPVR